MRHLPGDLGACGTWNSWAGEDLNSSESPAAGGHRPFASIAYDEGVVLRVVAEALGVTPERTRQLLKDSRG